MLYRCFNDVSHMQLVEEYLNIFETSHQIFTSNFMLFYYISILLISLFYIYIVDLFYTEQIYNTHV